MSDSYITIGDLDLVNILEDHYKLLIDDSTNGDTKAALVSVLKNYLIDNVTPHINSNTNTWYVGDNDTGVSVIGVEFSYNHPNIQYRISGSENWITLFNITALLPNVEVDNETLCWKVNGVLTDKSAVNARINTMNGNVSLVGADGIIINNDTANNVITISRTDINDNSIPPADIPSKVIRAGDGQLTIKWTDPSDLTADGVTYSIWDRTVLVRKIGSYPVDETDGDIVVINTIKNQYSVNGYIDSELTNGIAYYYKLFIYSVDNVVNRNPKNNMIGIPKKYFIYGVRIDETNSNPETSVVYTDDAVGMTGGSNDWDQVPIFANIQPCLFKNGSVNYYLSKSDYNYKANGVDLSNITSGNDGDVMIAFPKTAYMIYREGNYLYVKITNDPDAKLADERFCYFAHTRGVEGDRQNLYLGAYVGDVSSSRLRSLSGKNYTRANITNGRIYSKNNGNGYDLMSFYPLVLIQCLYLIKYKNLNSQTVLGSGNAVSTSGTLDTNGFNYGTSTGKIKLFGLEDFWGNGTFNIIDGIKYNISNQVMYAFNNFNNDGDNYIVNNIVIPKLSDSYIRKVQGTRELGFLPMAGAGSATTYYCDTADVRSNYYLSFGNSANGLTPMNGLFKIGTLTIESTSYTRLMYL